MSMAAILGGANSARRKSTSSARSEASSLMGGAQGRKANTLRPDMQICLKHHYKSKTYTSGSLLEGHVTITTQRDTPFDSIDIILIGCSMTRTEGYSAPHESTHTFLKLRMPVSQESYPTPRVLEAGATLTVPFTFVLPDFLTLSACHHKVDSDHVRDHHLCLPPSMGSSARDNWEKDDLAPLMAEVVYAIKARVWAEQQPASSSPPSSSSLPVRRVKIMEAVKSIQVLPCVPEAAPLSVTAKDYLYKMTKTKTLRKNLMSSKTGRLTVSGQQPRAIMLLPDGRVASGTTAQIDLRFEPATSGASDIQPPKITGVSAKIAAHTYYSAAAINSLPNMGDWTRATLTDRRGLYSTSVALPTAEPAQVGPWHMHHTRRDSGYGSDSPHSTASSSSSSECGGDDYDDDHEDHNNTQQQQQQQQQQQKQRRRRSGAIAGLMRQQKTTTTTASCHAPLVHHTASIQLPVPNLPTARRAFAPSFHSCILSRVYTLHVSVRVETRGGAGGTSTLSLELPLQIGVERATGLSGAGETLPSWEDALEDAAVDEFLRPRVVGVPQEAFRETSVLPGYGQS